MASCHDVALLACPLVHCPGGNDLYSRNPYNNDDSNKHSHEYNSVNHNENPDTSSCLLSVRKVTCVKTPHDNNFIVFLLV